MSQLDLYYRVKKNDVSLICSYLEAFDGMTTIRTPEPKPGDETVIHIMVTSDLKDQFDSLVKGLGRDIMIERTEP